MKNCWKLVGGEAVNSCVSSRPALVGSADRHGSTADGPSPQWSSQPLTFGVSYTNSRGGCRTEAVRPRGPCWIEEALKEFSQGTYAISLTGVVPWHSRHFLHSGVLLESNVRRLPAMIIFYYQYYYPQSYSYYYGGSYS